MNFTEDLRTNQTNRQSSGSFMHRLQLFYIPCLCLLGITGNLLCAIVFTTKSLRRIRSSSFLFLLALSDALFLLDLLPGWINMNFARTLYLGANLICQMQTYISFVVAFIHIWMVLAFTAERCLAVNFPLKHMSQCSTTLVRTMIILLVIPAGLFYIYPSFFASEVDQIGQCREKEEHFHYLNYINTIDTIITMFVPFLVVSILNILIIRKLFCSKEFRERLFENGSTYQYHRSPSRTLRKEETPSIQNETTTTTTNVSIKRKYHQRHVLNEVRLTKMLLAISLTCLSLNFPSYYSRLMGFYQKKDQSITGEPYTIWMLYRDIFFHYMSYLSYGINIFIYILFGANFRRALKRVFFSKKNFNWNFHRDQNPFRYSFGEMTTSMNHSLRRHHQHHPIMSSTCRRAFSSSRESFLQQPSSEHTGQS